MSAPELGPIGSGDAGSSVADPLTAGGRSARPLQIAALIKQVPVAESLTLGRDGRLQREGTALEMNPYCRRAVSKGVELARASGGACTVFTLGPPAAEDVLREAIAWGADEGVHLCDPAFAGSDTLATARALSEALRRQGLFDLVLVGRNSVDGDTGQIGPEVAELLELPFACGARQLEVAPGHLRLTLEHDDGWEEAVVQLPALVSVAERLCEPCKVDPEGRRAVPAATIRRVGASELGEGPWGDPGSPTRVGSVRVLSHGRRSTRLSGSVAEQVGQVMAVLVQRGALTPGAIPSDGLEELNESAARSLSSGMAAEVMAEPPIVAVLLEEDRPKVGAELLGTAARLAREMGGRVVALAPEGVDGPELAPFGADEVLELVGEPVEEDVATAVIEWARQTGPWAVLAPSTAFGREVAGRVAAALGSGLVGDAIGVDLVDGELIAAKPAFSGAMVADISFRSPVRLVTIRPGVLPVPVAAGQAFTMSRRQMTTRGRVRVLSRRRDDDVEVLARAEVVIGIGAGVLPDEYSQLSALAALLGAELAATRKVTDKGWAPRARQVGITGRSIAPRLYIALASSGKFNHMVGVRSAGTVVAINADPDAPVFGQCDIGIVGDWHEVVPAFEAALRRHQGVVTVG